MKCMSYFKSAAHISANANSDNDSYVYHTSYQWVAAQLTQNSGLNSIGFQVIAWISHTENSLNKWIQRTQNKSQMML